MSKFRTFFLAIPFVIALAFGAPGVAYSIEPHYVVGEVLISPTRHTSKAMARSFLEKRSPDARAPSKPRHPPTGGT